MTPYDGVPIIDTHIGFRESGYDEYAFITRQTKDQQSLNEFSMPAQYMFKGVPDNLSTDDPVSVTLKEMDKHGIEIGMVSMAKESGKRAVTLFPDRFVPQGSAVDPNDIMGTLNRMTREYEEFGIVSVSSFAAGTFPQVALNAPQMYPIYAKCVELDIPIFACAGIAGPRLKSAVQHVELIDDVMFDFPDLVFVTRHGCEPWEELAVKLMLKWPNLYYSTSAFAPKHYPKTIVDYANTRGADKIIYAGYFPAGLTLDRIFGDMPHVPFNADVWPKFLHENARKVLKLKG
ncbi:amidohydrolase family protein [Rhodococcus sp. IEGM 1379]|uniref:amidohydrolase family protein n=1 Tax=Rhodococcus sp. IEGM 1379 TaxID=3047086 RepID=UPI0024B7C348|nr:amidohydrolase family protein [Rhodococcus sp. IEGM 1379]MDI9914198.1 amidohydrolase family protein [Rhodococcus sp. IEGM 1379]